MNRRFKVTVVLCQLVGSLAFAFQVQVSEAPENLLALTLSTIKSAQTSLTINIYEMKSPEIGAAVVEKVESGVPVRVLIEGQPVGGMSDASLEIKDSIAAAMKSSTAHRDCRFYMMKSADRNSSRRFHFNHAKYAVVDNRSVLVASENFSSSDTVSKKKNRGWQVVMLDPQTTKYYNNLFARDADPTAEDIVEIVGDTFLNPLKGLTLWTGVEAWLPNSVRGGTNGLRNDVAVFDATSLDNVTSPESSLSGLEAFLGKASKTLEIELMGFSPQWGKSPDRSPLLTAVIEAARRGVAVRVLLNDESVFGGGKPLALDGEAIDSKKSKNEMTVDILNSLASKEGLAVEARIADLKAMGVSYIHNKGAIVDGHLALVSSINWNQNSVENNREVAVVLDSEEIGSHYSRLFRTDWTASADLR